MDITFLVAIVLIVLGAVLYKAGSLMEMALQRKYTIEDRKQEPSLLGRVEALERREVYEPGVSIKVYANTIQALEARIGTLENKLAFKR